MGCIGCVLDDCYAYTLHCTLGYSDNLWRFGLLALFGDLWVLLVLAMLAHGSLALATSPNYNDGILVCRAFLVLPTLLC